MGTPWKLKTGIGKATVILVTILSIAIFSCGLNWVLVFRNFGSDGVIGVLFVLGWIEFATLILSLLGIALLPAIQALMERAHRKRISRGPDDESR